MDYFRNLLSSLIYKEDEKCLLNRDYYFLQIKSAFFLGRHNDGINFA